MIIWLTGVSGSGKTTISSKLKEKLKEKGFTVEWYDGDRVRKELKIESDFSKDGILKNNFEVINKIKLIKDTVDYIIVSLITPYREIREYARKNFNDDYREVYIKCNIDTLIKRDTKGLYKKAINGEIDNLIGFSEKIPYEEPANPDLTLITDQITIDEAINSIYNMLGKPVK